MKNQELWNIRHHGRLERFQRELGSNTARLGPAHGRRRERGKGASHKLGSRFLVTTISSNSSDCSDCSRIRVPAVTDKTEGGGAGTLPSLVSRVGREGWNNSNRSAAGTTNPSRPVVSTPTEGQRVSKPATSFFCSLQHKPASHKKELRGGADTHTHTMDVAPGREGRSPP